MKDFLLIFRNDEARSIDMNLSPEQIQALMKPWHDWMGNIAAQNKLVARGNRLEADGNVIKPGKVVTNGPYVELKETVGGYTIIKAENLEEATEIAKGCPILNAGGNVEVRAIMSME